MIVLLMAMTLFHLVAGIASLGLAVRLLSPVERAHWRSKRLLFLAELMCWVYPVAAFACASFAWSSYQAGQPDFAPIVLAPLLWLIFMGLVFAIVDYAEDGVLGNARTRD